jgi:hypothetical protein
MMAAIEAKREAIADVCRRHGVVHLYLFGSAAGQEFRPGESDVDLLVEFGPIGGHAKAHAFFNMRDELEAMLGTRVDLVMTGAVRNRFIAREIERTKQTLYAA